MADPSFGGLSAGAQTRAADLFAAQGYLGPIRVLGGSECRRFLRALGEEERPDPDWYKGYAAVSPAFHALGTHPGVVGPVAALLGPDVMLWGASLITRRPGAVHPWHSDVETAEAAGGTLTVWIGLANTDRDSSLLLIPGSHRYGVSVQQVRHQHGTARDQTTGQQVLHWARERDPGAGLVQHATADGEALLFDGRLWHGSHNVLGRTRRAALLQYATPDTPIHIPAPGAFDWPFVRLAAPRPPCILVQGRDLSGANRIVGAPAAGAPDATARLTPGVHPLRLPLAVDASAGWQPHPLFRGWSAGLARLSCHASALVPGHSPHPPHRHAEEEILLVLAGEVDLAEPEDRLQRLVAGQFVYYPAQFAHTLRAASAVPADYLMLKWHGGRRTAGSPPPLPFGRFALPGEAAGAPAGVGYQRQPLFEGATGLLRQLRCHLTVLAPGAGYPPHTDPYDVVVLVLEGEVETLGECVTPHGVVCYPAGTPHGMANPAAGTARYLVFEFHGPGRSPVRGALRRLRSLSSRYGQRDYWKRRAKGALDRFREGVLERGG
ncbi:MAG: cupin domain-containing protein [Candidatus Latescibacterota bacterium]